MLGPNTNVTHGFIIRIIQGTVVRGQKKDFQYVYSVHVTTVSCSCKSGPTSHLAGTFLMRHESAMSNLVQFGL